MYATDAPQRLGFTELDMAFVAANLFTAGGDLPEITLRIFTAAMLHFPSVLKRAQAELDAVVGRERLPTFDDKNQLPYTRAVILETQRWRPLAPIGVAHAAVEDDWYEGYHIPKGTVVFPNLQCVAVPFLRLTVILWLQRHEPGSGSLPRTRAV
jgi:cytochrome P450